MNIKTFTMALFAVLSLAQTPQADCRCDGA